MISLIGINGRINSGKDTVGEIIRYIISKEIGRLNPQNDFVSGVQYTESKWEIKKFAQKLKTISGLLLGIDPKLFESQEFKNMTLREATEKGYISKDLIELLKDEVRYLSD